jgi:hypothetical protein
MSGLILWVEEQAEEEKRKYPVPLSENMKISEQQDLERKKR